MELFINLNNNLFPKICYFLLHILHDNWKIEGKNKHIAFSFRRFKPLRRLHHTWSLLASPDTTDFRPCILVQTHPRIESALLVPKRAVSRITTFSRRFVWILIILGTLASLQGSDVFPFLLLLPLALSLSLYVWVSYPADSRAGPS